MSKRPLLFPIVLLVAATAGLLAGGRQLAAQRAERQALTARIEILNTEFREQRRTLKSLGQDTVLAESRLEQLQTLATLGAGPTDPAREAEVAYWLARHARLRQLFISRPDQAIPALRLLSDEQWLSIAKRNSFGTETEIRRALGHARALAKDIFLHSIVDDVRAFASAGNRTQPSDIMALVPYLKDQTTADMLAQLEFLPAAETATQAGWLIRERAVVDEEYDSRYTINSLGNIMVLPPPKR